MDQLRKEKIRAEGWIESTDFLQQADAKLIKGQEMNIQQGKPALHTEQPFQAALERIGRNDDGNGIKRVGRLELLHLFNQRPFKVRMEGTSNNPKHQA
jgi:hypothetical protein